MLRLRVQGGWELGAKGVQLGQLGLDCVLALIEQTPFDGDASCLSDAVTAPPNNLRLVPLQTPRILLRRPNPFLISLNAEVIKPAFIPRPPEVTDT